MRASPQLQIKTLRRSKNPEEYKLYRAALEWDLAEPIIIENRQDLRSERQWKDKVEPYRHQVTNLITFCRRLPVTLLADDVGLGKTISAGLVISELMARNRVSKILIVCPKLLIPQWKEELETKFGLEGVEATGRELLSVEPPKEGGAVITTYHSARLHFEAIAKAGFEMLILDEAHKLRNLYGTEKAPQVAVRIRKALAERQFKYVLMLTATPVQNRLWDLYSLIDLLTVARGHENPFGSVGMFARNFIADNRTEARKLRTDKQDEFRSIVYGYMSRIRRADADLYFPDRKVQMHKVRPTPEELELISIVSKYIPKLNPLSQYSLLLALTSSPQALAAQIKTMARNKTAPEEFSEEVNAIVDGIGTTAKLKGLLSLTSQLKKEQPIHWRMVIFTESRETQTTIEAFLSEKGISCGLINGDSASRNQQAIQRFKTNPPEIHVIVSTRAGSEGVNLQVANVLVNYDLPWNPMIVEQRIGRIQRLASIHASVCVFNMILEDTFEEFIVGRLMEKLQLASHAIGDVESLLEAAGMDDDDSESFEEQIRLLVLAALAGKDTQKATLKAEKSIEDAKITLSQEEQNINQMLGGTEGAVDLGPRCPKLPLSIQSMDAKTFVLAALQFLGAKISQQAADSYLIVLDGRRELIHFDDHENNQKNGTHCRPGVGFFEQLVNRVAVNGLHQIEDGDKEIQRQAEQIAKTWVDSFKGILKTIRIEDALRSFKGNALLRVRATVAHDSYERLIEIVSESEGKGTASRDALQPLTEILTDPAVLRLPQDLLKQRAMEDSAIAEFCRFYEERLVDELARAGQDERKRRKLEDDFTPRLGIELVGLEGILHRELRVAVLYQIQGEDYQSYLTLIPSLGHIINKPELKTCVLSGVVVPNDCLGRCEISGKNVIRHLLKRSEISERMALPEHTMACALSGKKVLSDEIEKSAITGRQIASILLKTSFVSKKRAEPEFFSRCEFTSIDALENELAVSAVSGKRYRADEQLCSAVSGKTGHRSEFISCSETNQPLLPVEAQRCEVTGKAVMPGFLEECQITGKKVLPSQLEKSIISQRKALKKFFVWSSLSRIPLLAEEAIQSKLGSFCAPAEAKNCVWSGRQCHPEDIKSCELTGLLINTEYVGQNGKEQLQALKQLLDGTKVKIDKPVLWDEISTSVSKFVGSKNCKVESAELSPDGKHLAVCMEVRSWMGLKTRHAGLLYSLSDNSIVGQIVIGKREATGWKAEKQ